MLMTLYIISAPNVLEYKHISLSLIINVLIVDIQLAVTTGQQHTVLCITVSLSYRKLCVGISFGNVCVLIFFKKMLMLLDTILTHLIFTDFHERVRHMLNSFPLKPTKLKTF